MYKFTLIFSFIIISSVFAKAQDGNTPHSTRPLSKWEKMFPQIKYGDNVYKTGSNWLTFGYGPAWHTNKNVFNQSFAMAYHHRFRALYFNLGWHYAAPQLLKGVYINRTMEKLNDIHAGAGLRFEKRRFNFGFFIGPSFATTWIPENLSVSKTHNQLGAHTELQFTFKYFYDLGIGTSLYGSFNKRYQVVGIQLHFYFSNAFVMKY